MVACDAERRSLQGEGAVDEPTPDRLRRAVIARDGGKCLNCGSRFGLHVHHVKFRSLGGPTAQENLATLCTRCHSLVHHGVLRIDGTAPQRLRFADRTGRSLGLDAPADPLVEILVTGEAGTRVPDPGPEPDRFTR